MLNHLNRLYNLYNLREYVHPDPVEFLYAYPRREDREIAGLIASSLAYGNVCQILKSVSLVLEKMGDSPYLYLKDISGPEIRRQYRHFVHRFATGEHLSAMLICIKAMIKEFGSVYECFLSGFEMSDETILPALKSFTGRFNQPHGERNPGHLIASPEKKSACKRLNLFLRWMVRRDAVDPGGWDDILPSKLVIPLDIHMFRISRAFGWTRRNQANLLTALEITEKFKIWIPEDPVRFDFTLTRFGIRSDLNKAEVFDCI
ncbi:MAG: TIGR02757 family protein [Desulfobacterales bacterium]|jgi:uncharacterized protein (TIGR02757 family)|nr:TIGR02757 family protein [Desulfobacterales bacterium]